MLNFNATHEEVKKIEAIAARFCFALGRLNPDQPMPDKMSLMMDIEAAHCNGTELDLDGLLNAKLGDLGHDIMGIIENIDRQTGKLGLFLPRYAKLDHVIEAGKVTAE